MAATFKTGLSLLLEKPSEPLIVPKGDQQVIFQMPEGFYSKKYRKDSVKIRRKFEKKKIVFNSVAVKNTTVPFNAISDVLEINKDFSVFIPKHIEAAMSLVKVFMEAKTTEDLLSIAVYCRERVNPLLFNYALSVAMLHREDTNDVALPNFLMTFPAKFVEATVFSDVRRDANMLPMESREPIVIRKNFTSTDREPEQAVAYFREDIGINLHHWHWHLVYPTRGGPTIVGKDRRGELFYYMHEQVLARYNTERLCNNMEMVKSLHNLRESISEGYFPKLHQLNANRAWPPRFSNCFLRDLDRPADRIIFSISTAEKWTETIKQAIRDGQVVDNNGTIIKLDPVKGIDILGNIVESSEISVNRNLYGNLHNMIHVLIALCHDPEEKYLESFAIMGDVATAMRDPVFYRWHSTVNDIFVSHKITLPPYTRQELGFTNISITSLRVQVPTRKANELNTFWEQTDIDLSRGLDFVPKGPLPIRITYLQHGQFTYTITVNNATRSGVRGTIRIFMSPKYNREQQIHMFETERQLMIELDKFVVTLKPGLNTIRRQSAQSSVTVDFQTTFRNVDTSTMSGEELMMNNFCGCGWPDHMLIPKGTTAGYQMNLFAMVSDHNVDRVNQPSSDVCLGADSYCGLYNRKYPDSRNMGYPFDRSAPSKVIHLADFLTPNMRVVEVTIKHENRTVIREDTVNRPTVVPATQ